MFLSTGSIVALDDDADGKEIVDSFESTFLLLHLLPDAVDALGAALDVEMQSCFLQSLLYGSNKLVDIGFAALLGLVELLLDEVVGIVFKVFQADIFQLAFQFVQTQLMGEWGIEVSGLFAHLSLGLQVMGVTNLPHEVHTVSDHDENDTHILSKRKQQVAEVLALDDWVFLVELLYPDQSVNDGCYLLTIRPTDLFNGMMASEDTSIENDGQDAVTLQSCLFDGDECRLET